MARFLPALTGLLLFSATALAVAEPRFYQVIDAQGRMQTILAPDDTSDSDSSSAKKDSDVKQSEASKQSDVPKQKATAPVPAAPQSSQDSSVSVIRAEPNTDAQVSSSTDDTNTAPVERLAPEDDYIDSDELERLHFNPAQKKRFYLLDDGIGSRVEESDGEIMGSVENGPDLFPQKPEQSFRELHSLSVDITDPAALELLFSNKSLCLDKKSLKKAFALGKGVPQSSPIDHKTWVFVGGGGVVQAYKVGGEGLRKVTLSAYAKSDKSPMFVMPVIALADSKGCVVRAVTSGYFETWYAATKTRHHHLEGSLIMSSAEHFLLVVLPKQDNEQGDAGFPLTNDGMFAIKWHE